MFTLLLLWHKHSMFWLSASLRWVLDKRKWWSAASRSLSFSHKCLFWLHVYIMNSSMTVECFIQLWCYIVFLFVFLRVFLCFFFLFGKNTACDSPTRLCQWESMQCHVVHQESKSIMIFIYVCLSLDLVYVFHLSWHFLETACHWFFWSHHLLTFCYAYYYADSRQWIFHLLAFFGVKPVQYTCDR